jgi:hypothetical protein
MAIVASFLYLLGAVLCASATCDMLETKEIPSVRKVAIGLAAVVWPFIAVIIIFDFIKEAVTK